MDIERQRKKLLARICDDCDEDYCEERDPCDKYIAARDEIDGRAEDAWEARRDD